MERYPEADAGPAGGKSLPPALALAFMRWKVQAADARTGVVESVVIEAYTAEEAEGIARRRGLLVSSVGPDGSAPRAAAGRDDIGAASKSLVTVARVLDLAAACLFVASAYLVFVMLVELRGRWADITAAGLRDWVPFALMGALGPAGYGLFLIALSAIMRMLALVGPTLRDIARGSQKR